MTIYFDFAKFDTFSVLGVNTDPSAFNREGNNPLSESKCATSLLSLAMHNECLRIGLAADILDKHFHT